MTDKYTEYAHDNPYQERRIVLDRLQPETDRCRKDMIIVKLNTKNLRITFRLNIKINYKNSRTDQLWIGSSEG